MVYFTGDIHGSGFAVANYWQIAKELNDCGFTNEIYNVGCMHWNYEPVTLDGILKKDVRPMDVMLEFKIDSDLCQKAGDVLNKCGLTLEEAILLFIKETVRLGRIPFEYIQEDLLEAKRLIQLIIRVSERERDLIYQKMALLGTENLSAYIRKIAIDGYIINVDYTEMKNHAAQLQRVGNNINQVVKRMNQTGSLYKTDVAEVKKLLHDIWILERRLLSRSRNH